MGPPDGVDVPGRARHPDRPLHSLGAALADGPARVHLAAGAYPGGVVLPDGAELLSEGGAVVAAEAGVVLTAAGSARLEGVRISGGDVGLSFTRGTLRLERVRLSGQRSTGARLGGGRATVVDLSGEVETGAPTGLLATGGAQVVLRRARFAGPFRLAVIVEGKASLEADDLRTLGAATALRVSGGSARVRRLEAGFGAANALLVARGTFDARRVRVISQASGVFVNEGGSATLADLSTRSLQQSAAVVVLGRLSLRRASIDGSGDGALSVIGGKLLGRGVLLSRTVGLGLLGRNAELALELVELSGTQSPDEVLGDALHLRATRAWLRGLVVDRASGSGLLAGENAKVSVDGAVLHEAKVTGVLGDTWSTLWLSRTRVVGGKGPGLVLLEHARAELSGVEGSELAEPLLAPDCASGAAIRLARGTVPRGLPCVQVGPLEPAPPRPPELAPGG